MITRVIAAIIAGNTELRPWKFPYGGLWYPYHGDCQEWNSEPVPPNLKLLSGPGCPVCVTAQGDIDAVIELVQGAGITLVTFGDMMRVPGTESSLQEERSKGADIRVVYSPLDALTARKIMPDREVVFLGIGFETTAPAVGDNRRRGDGEGLT